MYSVIEATSNQQSACNQQAQHPATSNQQPVVVSQLLRSSSAVEAASQLPAASSQPASAGARQPAAVRQASARTAEARPTKRGLKAIHPAMTDFLGTLVTADGSAATIDGGIKLVMVLYSASWWGACGPFKETLKELYAKWNADGKVFEVVVHSGDRDPGGFASTSDGCPWLFVPFEECDARKAAIGAVIPCTGYPTPGVITAAGVVCDPDAWGKVDDANFAAWMAQAWVTTSTED
jgi:hypothetical protein